MSASAALLRRLTAEGIGVPDLGARVAKWLTHAIDREQADARAADAAGAHRLPPEARLRLATFFCLACGVLFLPVEGSHLPRELLASLLVLYGIHAALTSFVLIAGFTEPGVRHANALALLLVVGHAVNLDLYLWIWPKYPGLPAAVLACLLMGSAVLFSWSTGRVLVLALAFSAGFVLLGVARPHELQRPDFAVAFIVLVVGAATAVGCARLLAVLRSSLAQRQRELTHLSARLMAVQEDERRRLARDLHDEFGQALTAVNAHLWLIERQPAEEDALRKRAAEARRLVNRTISSMRELSQLLRPAVLDALGLIPSLDGLLKSFGESHRIGTTLAADELPDRLPHEMETALYRITQEALTNVARHAHASRVRVALALMAGEVRLEIEDDGVGFKSRNGSGPLTGTGLIGIRERVRALRGEMTVASRKGVRLTVQVPLPAAA
jgi:signal transduction histidine kinase